MNDRPAQKPVAGMKTMALTFALAVGLALGIRAAFGPGSLASTLMAGAPIASQVVWGAAMGLMFSIPVVIAILRLPVFLRLREHSIARSRMIDLRGFHPVWISLLAGIGEELLFRGAIQPLMGLWLTSAVFSLVHIQPSQYRALTAGTLWYAAFIFLVSLLLGAIYTNLGLVAAMAFHTTGDLVGLFALRHLSRIASVEGEAGGSAPAATGTIFPGK
jgi:membrane protease YdiL (CAAX protease family)